MVCKVPENDTCYFSGPCEYNSEGSLTVSSADLNGDNVCFDIHANYTPQQMKQGNTIKFKIDGTISPHASIPDVYPPTFTFSVQGTRKYGEERFHATGNIGKYADAKVQIDASAQGSEPDAIVLIKVTFPSKALIANRVQ